MSIDNFMTQHIDVLQDITSELPHRFSSHEFIQKFARRFESDYIDFLQQYKQLPGQRGAFRAVHQQIARFLSENSSVLHIRKSGRADDQNIFGNDTENQFWERVDVV